MEYRCVATSVAGFVQQLAVSYISNGYLFYVMGTIPLHKDPSRVDQKLIAKYDIAISKWTRYRRRKRGLASVQYLRFDRTFVLVATRGQHRFFEHESAIRDFRRNPLSFEGYSIGYKVGADNTWHASVRIHPREYLNMKAYFLDMATRQSVDGFAAALQRIPFEPYAPVRRQVFNILRAANRKRKRAGYELVESGVVLLTRTIVSPFADLEESANEKSRL